MIYRDEEVFKLVPFKVFYQQHGVSQENYATSKTPWESSEKLGHISDVSFVDVEYSEEQIARLEEVKNLSDSEWSFVQDYVMDGTLSENSQFFLKKKIELQNQAIAELTTLISMGGM